GLAQNFWYFDGTMWQPFIARTNGWLITGNSGTDPATPNFIGTIDNLDWHIKTNQVTQKTSYQGGYASRLAVTNAGKVGISTESPTELLELKTGNIYLNQAAVTSPDELRFQTPSGSFYT